MKLSAYLMELTTESNNHSPTESSPLGLTKALSSEDVATARSEEATTAERGDSQPADSDVAGLTINEGGGLSDASTTQAGSEPSYSPTDSMDLSSLSPSHKALHQPLAEDGISESPSTATSGTAFFNARVQHSRLDIAALTAQLQVGMHTMPQCTLW